MNMFTKTTDPVGRARALVIRGGPFTLTERQTIGGVWPEVEDSPIGSLDDAKLHEVARRFYVPPLAARKLADLGPFAESVAEAEAALSESRERHASAASARDTAARAVRDLRRTQRPDFHETQGAERSLRQSEARFREADEELSAALVHRNGLKMKAQQWRREQEATASLAR